MDIERKDIQIIVDNIDSEHMERVVSKLVREGYGLVLAQADGIHFISKDEVFLYDYTQALKHEPNNARAVGMSPDLLIPDDWLLNSPEYDEDSNEYHNFNCEPNRKEKGHVKPFYRKGRW